MPIKKEWEHEFDRRQIEEYAKADERRERNRDRWALAIGSFLLSMLPTFISWLREHLK